MQVMMMHANSLKAAIDDFHEKMADRLTPGLYDIIYDKMNGSSYYKIQLVDPSDSTELWLPDAVDADARFISNRDYAKRAANEPTLCSLDRCLDQYMAGFVHSWNSLAFREKMGQLSSFGNSFFGIGHSRFHNLDGHKFEAFYLIGPRSLDQDDYRVLKIYLAKLPDKQFL